MRYEKFRVKDLFGSSKLGKYHNIDTLKEDDNGYPYICASNLNNGINKTKPFVNGSNLSLTPKNIIAWGKQCPMFTYHKEQCVTSQGMYYIELNDLSEESALYLCAVFTHVCKDKYSYSNCLIGTKMDNEIIFLPTFTNPDNTPVIDPEHKYHPEGYIPDWEYMQDYIKELEQDYIKELEQDYIKELEQYLIVTGLNDYELTDEDREVLSQKIADRETSYQDKDNEDAIRNGREVREFIVSNIATVSYGNKFDKNKMTKNNPCINFVSRTANNNGISDYVDIYREVKPLKPGLITLALGGSVGSCFLQEKPFYSGQNVGVIDLPKEISKEAKLYFISSLEKKCKNSFHAFGNEINKHLKTDLSVLLPVKDEIDPTHQYHPEGYVPDWEYMEKYIRAIEKLVIKDVVKYKNEMIEKMREITN